MFGPDYTAGCPHCSAIADGFDGFVVHLANHDVTLSAVSRAPLAKLQAYKRRGGGRFPGRPRSAAILTSTSTSGSARSNSAGGGSNTTTGAAGPRGTRRRGRGPAPGAPPPS